MLVVDSPPSSSPPSSSTASRASSILSAPVKSVSANSSSVSVIVYSTMISTALVSTIVILIISTEPSGSANWVSNKDSKLSSYNGNYEYFLEKTQSHKKIWLFFNKFYIWLSKITYLSLHRLPSLINLKNTR